MHGWMGFSFADAPIGWLGGLLIVVVVAGGVLGLLGLLWWTVLSAA
jgi:hypothetical protein